MIVTPETKAIFFIQCHCHASRPTLTASLANIEARINSHCKNQDPHNTARISLWTSAGHPPKCSETRPNCSIQSNAQQLTNFWKTPDVTGNNPSVRIGKKCLSLTWWGIVTWQCHDNYTDENTVSIRLCNILVILAHSFGRVLYGGLTVIVWWVTPSSLNISRYHENTPWLFQKCRCPSGHTAWPNLYNLLNSSFLMSAPLTAVVELLNTRKKPLFRKVTLTSPIPTIRGGSGRQWEQR